LEVRTVLLKSKPEQLAWRLVGEMRAHNGLEPVELDSPCYWDLLAERCDEWGVCPAVLDAMVRSQLFAIGHPDGFLS
jgi:hypothetical protein